MNRRQKTLIIYGLILLVAYVIFSIEIHMVLYPWKVSTNEFFLDRIESNFISYSKNFISYTLKTPILLLMFWRQTLAFFIYLIATLYLFRYIGNKLNFNKRMHFKLITFFLPILIFLVFFTIYNGNKINAFIFESSPALLTNSTYSGFTNEKYDYSFTYPKHLDLRWGCMHESSEACFDIVVFDPTSLTTLLSIKVLDPEIHSIYEKSLDEYLREIGEENEIILEFMGLPEITEFHLSEGKFKNIKSYHTELKKMDIDYKYIWLERNSIKFEIYFLEDNEKAKELIESLNF